MVEVVKSTGGIKTKCKVCKSVLRYSTRDIKTVSIGANYGGDTPDDYPAIECPVCGNNHILK